MHVLYVHSVYVWCPQRPDEGVRAFGTEVKENCKPPCAFWEPHPVLVEEQQMLLATEPTFWRHPRWIIAATEDRNIVN